MFNHFQRKWFIPYAYCLSWFLFLGFTHSVSHSKLVQLKNVKKFPCYLKNLTKLNLDEPRSSHKLWKCETRWLNESTYDIKLNQQLFSHTDKHYRWICFSFPFPSQFFIWHELSAAAAPVGSTLYQRARLLSVTFLHYKCKGIGTRFNTNLHHDLHCFNYYEKKPEIRISLIKLFKKFDSSFSFLLMYINRNRHTYC